MKSQKTNTKIGWKSQFKQLNLLGRRTKKTFINMVKIEKLVILIHKPEKKYRVKQYKF